jgi:hypothetical protein
MIMSTKSEVHNTKIVMVTWTIPVPNVAPIVLILLQPRPYPAFHAVLVADDSSRSGCFLTLLTSFSSWTYMTYFPLEFKRLQSINQSINQSCPVKPALNKKSLSVKGSLIFPK